MVKEEKEALFDKDKLENDLKESRKSKSKEFEFGGPVGAFFSMLLMPILVYDLYFFCNGKDNKCSFMNNPLKLPHWRKFFDEGHLIYDGWLLFQFLLFFVPIGKVRIQMYFEFPHLRFCKRAERSLPHLVTSSSTPPFHLLTGYKNLWMIL